MRARARKDSALSLFSVLAATLVAASVLGLVASRLALMAIGDDTANTVVEDAPSPFLESDVGSEHAGDMLVSLTEPLSSEFPGMERLVSDDVTTLRQSLPVPEAAQGVLRGYQAQGNCLLCEAGYLDLQGNVWACVVQGDGWVEVQVVRSVEAGQASELTAIHMDAASWARELDEVMGEES